MIFGPVNTMPAYYGNAMEHEEIEREINPRSTKQTNPMHHLELVDFRCGDLLVKT